MLAPVLDVLTDRPLPCEQMEVLKTPKTNYSQFKCRIFSPLALSAVTLKMFDCLEIIFFLVIQLIFSWLSFLGNCEAAC